MARIAVFGFLHESNSFSALRTPFEAFDTDGIYGRILKDAELFQLEQYNVCAGGFTTTMRAQGHEIIPLLYAEAEPSGPVEEDAFESILTELLDRLVAAGPIDAVYADLHGAMLATHDDDADGAILSRIRERLGPEVRIAVTVDLHANISARMLHAADILLPYRTYPHVDMFDLGIEAAKILDELLKRKDKACYALTYLDFMFPVNRQCTIDGPMRALIEKVAELKNDKLLSLSIAAGFQPADIEYPVPAIFAYAYSQDEAEAAVAKLKSHATNMTDQFDFAYASPKTAIDAARHMAKPVILADAQDNPGGGGSGDTMFLAHALRNARQQNVVYGPVYDPVAAALFVEAGEGKSCDAKLGGLTVPGDAPFEGRFTVRAISDGAMQPTGPMLAGQAIDLGAAAWVECDGLNFVVTSRRHQGLDRGFFLHFGLDPARADIIVLKSAVHYRSDFDPITDRRIDVIAPGFETMDFSTLPYSKLAPGIRFSG
ncbi:MAG: M81 family metallopeptidase [Sphingorhabdus sp.]